MDKNEIDAARAQATQVAAVLTPLLTALQSASAVLSLASNAEKQKGALVQDLAALTTERDNLLAGISAQETQLADLKAAVAVAKTEADAQSKADIKAAKDRAKAAEAAAQARAEAAAAAAAEKEAEFTAHIAEVQKKTDADVASLFVRAQTAEEAAEAAEKRLKAVRDQAAKMAAAIGG